MCQLVPEIESVSAEVSPNAVTAEEMIVEAEELIKINDGDEKVDHLIRTEKAFHDHFKNKKYISLHNSNEKNEFFHLL